MRSYDAYGGARVKSGTGLPGSGYVGGIGHVEDDECGLIYMRARYYDPELGRWISEDPGQNGRNWYGYCEGNPVNSIDSNGRKPQKDFNWYVYATIMWTAVPAPGIRNPFLKPALEALVGMEVNQKYVDRLANNINQYHIMDIINGSSLAGLLFDLPGPVSLLSNIATAVMSYRVMLEIALIACDIAFEEGR